MIRTIIQIDPDKCNGCGLCAAACQEGAIAMVEGKAALVRDDYCDGLGNCLPACPTGAISFVQREAAPFDEAAVERHLKERAAAGCPGTQARTLSPTPVERPAAGPVLTSQLRNWPVQIKLAPITAPYFSGANLLIAADCCAYAYGDFHRQYIQNRVALIGCPKLDGVDYTDKLTAILRENDIRSLTIVRMQVPCCGGLERAATAALKNSGRFIPWQVVTVTTDGRILD